MRYTIHIRRGEEQTCNAHRNGKQERRKKKENNAKPWIEIKCKGSCISGIYTSQGNAYLPTKRFRIRLYLQRLVRACLEATSTRLRISGCRLSWSKSTDSRATWLPHDTVNTRILVQVSAERTHNVGGEGRDWRHATQVVAEQGRKTSWRAARGRSDGGITLSDVPVGCTCGEAWRLHMQGLHVGH